MGWQLGSGSGQTLENDRFPADLGVTDRGLETVNAARHLKSVRVGIHSADAGLVPPGVGPRVMPGRREFVSVYVYER